MSIVISIVLGIFIAGLVIRKPFPHGVAVTHEALLNNLSGHAHGMQFNQDDRCISWLPWYHDMGLVGCFLSPIANQMSADYLKTEDFARRPLSWLTLISRNPDASLSYSPTFGYDICKRGVQFGLGATKKPKTVTTIVPEIEFD